MGGDNEWIQIKPKTFYSLHSYFGNLFVDNLVMNKEKTMIELIKHSEIKKVYHSDIIGAKYFVPFDAMNKTMIESEQDKIEFIKNAQSYSFGKIEEIAFKIPNNQRYAKVYVQPKSSNSIFLLKQIKL